MISQDADPARILPPLPPSTITEGVLHLQPAGTPAGDAPAAIDVDGTYLAYLGAAGAVAALIRPDHYLFGTAATLADLPALISDLRRQLAVYPAVPAVDPAVPAADPGASAADPAVSGRGRS